MKYNPDYHSNVVRNIRTLADKESIATDKISDADIWQIFEDWHGTDVSDTEPKWVTLYGEDDAAYLVGINEYLDNIR